MQISAAVFKAKCFKIMDQVYLYHNEVIITKHGKPVAKLVPYSDTPEKSLFGYMKNTVQEAGDITKPIDESWEMDK